MVMKDAKMCCLRRTFTISALLMTMVLSIGNVHVVNGLSSDVRSTTRTSSVEPLTTTNTDIPTSSSYAPVTLSSLSSFARKFWTTMASMASTTKRADDVDLNTSSTNDDVHDSTNTTPIVIFDPISSDTHGVTSVTVPSVSLSRLRDTFTTSENDAFIQEFPRATSRRPRLTSSRKIRKNYYPTTFVPTSIPKISDNEDRATPDGTTNEFRNNRLNSNFRSGRLRSGDRPSSSSSPVVTNETPREPITKSTTLCNDTTSEGTGNRHRGERPEQIIGTSLAHVTWPPPPPKFLKEEFSVGLSDDREPQHHPGGSGGQELGQLFTSEPSSYPPQPDLDTDFEVIPGIATPLSASSFSRPSESLQAPKRDFPLTTTKSQVEYSVGQGRNRLSSTTLLPKSSSRPAPLKELPTNPPLPRRPELVTESASPDSEVSLADLFDQDIIDNKTLLASSMFKLSSILTSSVQTQEAEALAANGSSDAHRRPTTSVPLTSDDESTSDFDFSTLFASESLAPPTSNSFTHSSSSETTSTLPSSDLGGEDHPPTNDEVALLTLVNKNITSNNRLASLMSTGVKNSFAVQDVDDVDDNDEGRDDFELVSEGLASQFEEAGLVEGMREQPEFKTLNRFSAQIRAPVKNSSEEPGECLFNVTDQARLCDWTFGSESSVHWSFGLGESAFMSGGPTLDSNGQTEGGYVFMDTSCGLQGPSNEIQRGSFESPLMSKTAPHGRCFTFWYNMGGLSADRLRVLLIPEEQFHAIAQVASRMPSFTTLWERKDTTNGTWMKGEVLYTFSKEHRLIFEGFARSGSDSRRKFQGYLAVDDLVIDSESCKAFCTFEGVLCEWENDEANDEFDWELARGSNSHLTGPVRDHGDGPEGGFMFIDTAFPRRPGDIARLRSPELPSTVDGPVCFRFWTHMYGNGIGTLRVVLVDSTDEKNVIWEVSGESGNSWHMAQVTVASSNSFRLSLEGMVGRNALGRIAIDDLSFGPGPCPSSPQSALPLRGDCTFESDECGWVNAGSGDHYDWLRTSAGQALLPGQGPNSGYRPPEPLSDHTTGLSSGFFLTMERSTIPPRGGDQAYVVGPTLQGTTGNNRCFSFWGYMHERSVDAAGPGLGSLRLYLRVGTSSILRPIWRLINYEHPDWFFAQAPINTNDKFQVVIGGTWGSTRQGAISVDDFTFFEGNCSVIPAEAEVIPGECTFDTNMCEWNSGLNRSRELSTWQLATSVRRPSNLDDHTYRATAGYVFFDIFSQQPHVVRLESPEIIADNETFWAATKTKGLSTTDDANSLDAVDDDDNGVDTEHCLTFWFAPFGSSRNTFLRILQRDTASTNETQVWGVTTANFQAFRPEWVYGQVALNVTYTHRIIFEGSSNNGGFALDDIMFVPGTCQSRPDNSS